MPAIERIAVILCDGAPSANDRNAARVLDFFGVRSVFVPSAATDLAARVADAARDAQYCIVASVPALDRAWPTGAALPSILEGAAATFICEFARNDASLRWLRRLSADSTAALELAPGGDAFCLCRTAPEFTGPMSGVRVRDARAVPEVAFRISGESSVEPVVTTAAGATFMFRSPLPVPPVFVASSAVDLDIDTPVDGNCFDIRDHFLATAPIAMFTLWAFRGVAWSRTKLSASLVVDDPLLRPRYGYLVYKDVLDHMLRHGFSTTIAFIPWNWRRTRSRTAHMFLQHPQKLSIVVHGNDHTSGEFGVNSVDAHARKIRTATHRMRAHEKRARVPWTPVMVFPQGIFSTQALPALKAANFVAAVNTNINAAGTGRVTTTREAWGTAVMSFSSFPIFTRRYMDHGVENFAFDMLLGKPCILVVHHDAFSAGARSLLAFLAELRALNGSLEWRPLHDTVVRSYRMRPGDGDSCAVQMVANELIVTNESCEPVTYRFSKREAGGADALASVTVDGVPITWNCSEDALRFEARIAAGQSSVVRVEYKSSTDEGLQVESAYYHLKCAVRRILSEVRDDYICRNALLTKWTDSLRRHLR